MSRRLSWLLHLVVALPALAVVWLTVSPPQSECWEFQKSGVAASLRGICAVSDRVCWASGSEGTVLRTTDGGNHWNQVGPEGMTAADFRDVHAWDAETAVILAAGDPDRIYRTVDGGRSWSEVYGHPDAAAFFDGMVFDRDGKQGWLMGDPLEGRLFLLRTGDGGQTWERVPPELLPAFPEGMAAFAASGTNVFLADSGQLWIGLGGGKEGEAGLASICALEDTAGWKDSANWRMFEVPLPSGPSAGIFSIVALDSGGREWVAVGGDYTQPGIASGNAVFSRDGGVSWQIPESGLPGGYRSAVALAGGGAEPLTLVAVGPNGTDCSTDRGSSWKPASATGFHTLSFVRGTTTGWAAGAEGRIARWKN